MTQIRRLVASLGAVVLALAVPGSAGAYVAVELVLNGAQEVPKHATPFRGVCNAILDLELRSIEISCTHDVPDAIAAHIHLGERGVAGPIVFALGDPASPMQAVITDLTDAQISDFVNANYYVNFHTPAFPGGIIRGQIETNSPVGGAIVRFPLEGGQEAPPVASEHSGKCTAVLGAGQKSLVLDCQHDVDDATAAHIHMAEPGVAGPVIFDLVDPASPIQVEVDLTDPENEVVLDALQAGTAYVNVHTPANPGGEIRGQIAGCVGADGTLCLGDRFEVTVNWETEEGDTGFGRAVPETNDSGMFWFFGPQNLEVLVKVLDGCSITEHFWVFFAATTDVGFELTVTDTVADESKTYTNEVGAAADAVTDTSALDTCDAGE
jgi:hypothetical protein